MDRDNHHGNIHSRNNIAFCPSAIPIHGGEGEGRRTISYALRALGKFTGLGLARYGTTRMSAIENPHQGAPKTLAMDVTWAAATTDPVMLTGQWAESWRSRNNHFQQGANVVVGDCSAKWYPWEDLRPENNGGSGTSNVMVVRNGLYTQHWNSGVAPPHVNEGSLSVWYPNGTFNNDHDKTVTSFKRRLFGYNP